MGGRIEFAVNGTLMRGLERNGDLVPRARFAETRLESGDRLEVVHFVQGG